MTKIAFIGSGNMASAIAGGIVSSGLTQASNIVLFDKNIEQYGKFHKDCFHASSIEEAINISNFIFISVKPQVAKEVLPIIKSSSCLKDKVFVSICAGITISSIEEYLPNTKIVRAMPNTPLLIGCGVTALCKNANVSDEDFDYVNKIFSSSGYVSLIEEKDMNNVTAITGSSPAYVYLFIKSIYESAKKNGFNYDDTVKMICETVIGASKMILQSPLTIDELIQMVKSPNGTTERALNVLNDNNFESIIHDAIVACAKRADELSKSL